MLEVKLPFDEQRMLEQYIPHMQRSVGLQRIELQDADGSHVPEGVVDKDGPLPAEPKIVLQTGADSVPAEQ